MTNNLYIYKYRKCHVKTLLKNQQKHFYLKISILKIFESFKILTKF